MDGSFTLAEVPQSGSLQFSFAGMQTQEVIVGNQTNISVTMEETTIGLEEIVAIGY